MTEGPQVQAFGLQWREGEIHRLPEGFDVTWEPGADGQMRVTELGLTLLDKYDYADGQLSDAISLMTELRKLDIYGWQWVGKMPESMGDLNSLCELTIERTNFESLPEKLNLRNAYWVIISRNPKLSSLGKGITEFGYDFVPDRYDERSAGRLAQHRTI